MSLRIKTWILAASSIVLIPLVLLLIWGFEYSQREERDRVEAEVHYQLSQLVDKINERLAVSVQALQTLGNSEAAYKKDWAALHESARRVAATNDFYAAITLVDANNQLVFVTNMPYGKKTFNTNHVELVREAFETRMPNVSGVFKVPISEHFLVAVSVPLYSDGEVTHVIRMILRTETISQLLEQQALPQGWIAAIADRDGQILARNVASSDFVGKPGSTTFQAAIKRNDQLIYRGVSLEGVPDTSMVMPVFRGYWFAAVAVPDAILEQSYRRKTFVVGTVILLVCLWGFAVSRVMSSFISKEAMALERVVETGRHDITPARPFQIAELAKVYERYQEVSRRETIAQSSLVTATLEKDEITDLYDHAPCGYHSLDASGVVVRMNQTELNWIGYTRDQVLGKHFMEFISEASREVFKANFPKFLAQGHIENLEFELLRSDGTVLPVSISGTMIRDQHGVPVLSRSTVFDITERKKLEKHLEALSNSDALTGLPNRRRFYEVATTEVERSKRHQNPLALAMLDIDHFKKINDQHGHPMGDLVLKNLAAVSRSALRQIDMLARYGGEEFVILMPHTDRSQAMDVLDRLRETLQAQQLRSDAGAPVSYTISIGTTQLQAGDTDIDAMLKRADDALYAAKRSGRNQVWADPS